MLKSHEIDFPANKTLKLLYNVPIQIYRNSNTR